MKRLRSIALLGAIVALGVTACDNDTGPVPGVDSVQVSPDNVTINVGETVQLSASVSTTGDASSDVNWTSSNGTVASVTDGTVTGNAEGTATITATSVEDATKSDATAVTVVTPEPQKITIASYRAVSNEETDNDGPVSSPDTVGTLCCEPATGVSPFTVLEVTYDVDPGNEEIDRVQMILNGDVVAEQTISSKQAAALAHADENVTLSKSTLDWTGSMDGNVYPADVPNGSVEISGKVIFADGSSKTVTNSRQTYVKNHQHFIVAHTAGGNTAVDSSGDRWYGGTTLDFALTLVDHWGIGLNRVTLDPSVRTSFDIGNGVGTPDTLMGAPYTFSTSASANAGIFGDFGVGVMDPRDSGGESFTGTSQTVPWMVDYVQNFNDSATPPLMLVDYAAPSASGAIAVQNSEDGTVSATGGQFFSTGVFTNPSASDMGIGIVDGQSTVFDVNRPVGSPTETFSDVDGIADLPERVNDMEVVLASIADVLGNTNTSPGVSSSAFGVDKTDPTYAQQDSIGGDALVIKSVPNDTMYGHLFAAADPDNPAEPTDATAGVAVGVPSGIFEVTDAFLLDATGSTVLGGNAGDMPCCTSLILDYDRNDDGTVGDYFFNFHSGGPYQGTGFTMVITVRDSASANNNTQVTIGPFAIDSGPPQTTMIDPPPANVASSQNSLQFSVQARTTDGINLNDITVLVETPGADDDCTARGDNSLLTQGSGPGNVDDNTVAVATDLDATSYEFSNDASADAGALSFVIQNNETDATADNGENQSICWVVTSSDDAQDNMGNPDPWTNDRITRTDIDWQ